MTKLFTAAVAAAPLVFASALLPAGALNAQSYPVKPVTVIVSTSPATGPGIVSRMLAPGLGQRLGQPVIVENRVGASGAIGMRAVANAPPDGYTLLMCPSTISTIWLSKTAAIDPFRDFAPVAKLADVIFAFVVNPQVPANSISELIALARSKPGQINYATPGNGTPQHLWFEQLKQVAKIDLTHIPYKTTDGLITDLVGGRVQVATFGAQSVLSQVTSGRLRIIATDGDKRSPWTPGTPTLRETGLLDAELHAWNAMFAPRNTPREIVRRVSRETVSLLSTPEMKEALLKVGLLANPGGPEVLAALLKSDMDQWQKVVSRAGIVIQ